MPVPRGAASKKQLKRYGEACRGQEVCRAWEPAWDGMLYYPLCCYPGFMVEKIKLYLKKGKAGCRGYCYNILGGGLLVKGYNYRSICACDGCGFMFHLSVIAMYICRATYNPVWLGQTTIPDITKPYIVWYCNLPAPYSPYGLGGGYIGGNI